MTDKECFFRWLKENDAYEKFMYNNSRPLERSFTKIEDNNNSASFIWGTFVWERTNEGEDYWAKLSSKWVKLKNGEISKLKEKYLLNDEISRLIND